MKKISQFSWTAALLTVPLLLASCGGTHAPATTAGVMVQTDGSVTYQGQTMTEAQIRARAADLDAQFRAETQNRLTALQAERQSTGFEAQALGSGYAVTSKAVALNLITGHSDDCFYMNLAVMRTSADSSRAWAEYSSANSTKVAWWRVKGYATLNTTVYSDVFTDLRATCTSASTFFGGRVELGRSEFRLWAPGVTSSDVSVFQASVQPNYGVIRSGETDYLAQGYTRAVSYQRNETAVGVAPSYWSRTY
ncbi:hypothetical protein [Deinococcus multiflagellatus]|uniref:Lipoprotein n=1 Tax=Deinococcus multiflagellatus TaxID=1656887 RepID=A0ABW1ZNE3_9DEIO|nr:hypothetical protein [Deinococcus multiflagellatus]MBZ9715585.1 hypothetical protein [Deinococcus multiflagellatus]